MQTATIEVTYVGPPKEGKQYGSIKGVNNDSWPVKRDRIREFEPNNKYEIAYTEGKDGFRNIIGVKRIVPQTDMIDNRPQQNGAQPRKQEFWQPKPADPGRFPGDTLDQLR